MMNLDYSNKWDKKCPQIQCRKDQCTGLTYVFIPATLGDDRKGSKVAPKNGAYCNSIVLYEATNAVYIYSKEGIPTKTSNGGYTFFNDIIDRPFYNGEMMTSNTSIPKVPENVSELTNDAEYQTAQEVADAVASEAYLREVADNDLQEQIDTIVASSDVKDIVGTYAELQAYDTSTLGNNDIIKVLQDETHNDAETYYRWNSLTQSFTYIGELGPFYTKAETDNLLDDKQDTLTAGDGIDITNNVISTVIDEGIYKTTRTYVYVDGTSGNDNNTGLVSSSPLKTLDAAMRVMNSVGGSLDIRIISAGDYDITGGVFDSANLVFEKYPSTLSGDVNIRVITRGLTFDNSMITFTNVNLFGWTNGAVDYTRNAAALNSHIQFGPGALGLVTALTGSTMHLSNGTVLNNQLTVATHSGVFFNGVTLKMLREITTNASFVALNASSEIYISGTTTLQESPYNGFLHVFSAGGSAIKVANAATFISSATTKFRRVFYTEKSVVSVLDSQVATTNAFADNAATFGTSTLRINGNATVPYIAGSNISISGSTISGNYQPFTGTDGNTAGAAGLVPAPAATDAGKILGADGTWKAIDHTFETFTFTLVDDTVVTKNIAVEA